MITNKQLVNYCKAALGAPYWYGCFGQISTKALYYNKRKQYPQQYEWSIPKEQLNRRVFDCVGLIKGAIWSDADIKKNPKYKASQDVSANGMLDRCKTKGKIKTLPEVAGVLVFKNGHVGVYIGGGYVIEAKGHKWGVIKSKLSATPWTDWGYCPYIEYVKEEKPKEEKPKEEKPKEDKPVNKYYPKCATSYKSIVDALESLNIDGRFYNRKRIAAANGIKNYKGSYQQNIDMLNMLKAGKLKKV